MEPGALAGLGARPRPADVLLQVGVELQTVKSTIRILSRGCCPGKISGTLGVASFQRYGA